MIKGPRARLPADFLHLAGFALSLVVSEGFRFVVIKTALGRPIGMGLSVEGPIRYVEAFDRIRHGLLTERIRREPARPVPLANRVSDIVFAEFKLEQTLGPKGLFDLFVREHRR